MLLASGGPPGLPPGAGPLVPVPGAGDPGPRDGQGPQPADDAPPPQPQGESVCQCVIIKQQALVTSLMYDLKI